MLTVYLNIQFICTITDVTRYFNHFLFLFCFLDF